jgi:hypothetical protein
MAHRRTLSALRASFEFARSQGRRASHLPLATFGPRLRRYPVAPPGLGALLMDPGAACFALAPGYLRAAPSALPVGPSVPLPTFGPRLRRYLSPLRGSPRF